MKGAYRNHRIQVLAFDAYGTLFDPGSVNAVSNELFPNQGNTLSQIWRTKQLEYTWLCSLMERYVDFWKLTEDALIFACKSLGLSCQSYIRDRLMEAYLHLNPYPEVPQALTSLSSYPLAILSNGSPRMLEAMIKNARLEEAFEYIISAHEAGIYKPSPRVYRLAPKKTGVDRNAIGFVSSNPFDVMGAKSFGFWTCWVNRLNNTWNEFGFLPDEKINNLTKLVSTVKLLR